MPFITEVQTLNIAAGRNGLYIVPSLSDWRQPGGPVRLPARKILFWRGVIRAGPSDCQPERFHSGGASSRRACPTASPKDFILAGRQPGGPVRLPARKISFWRGISQAGLSDCQPERFHSGGAPSGRACPTASPKDFILAGRQQGGPVRLASSRRA
jgi:hypothetical protein